jgi:hypothetical protein
LCFEGFNRFCDLEVKKKKHIVSPYYRSFSIKWALMVRFSHKYNHTSVQDITSAMFVQLLIHTAYASYYTFMTLKVPSVIKFPWQSFFYVPTSNLVTWLILQNDRQFSHTHSNDSTVMMSLLQIFTMWFLLNNFDISWLQIAVTSIQSCTNFSCCYNYIIRDYHCALKFKGLNTGRNLKHVMLHWCLPRKCWAHGKQHTDVNFGIIPIQTHIKLATFTEVYN